MNFFVDRYIGLADFSATIERLTSFEDAFARALADETKPPHVVTASRRRRRPWIAERRRARPARRSQARSCRRPGAGPAGIDACSSDPRASASRRSFRAIAGLWPFGSGEIHQPAYAKLMLLPQRPYIPIGPLARGARLSGGKHRIFPTRSCARRWSRSAFRRSRSPRRQRQLADAAVGRRAAAARGRARAAGRAGLAVPRRINRLARREERGQSLSRDHRNAAAHDDRLDRPSVDANAVPQAPHRSSSPTKTGPATVSGAEPATRRDERLRATGRAAARRAVP